MTPIRLGLIALLCWVAYGVFLFSDLYLRYPVAGIALRLLVPWAVLCNLFGIGMGVARIRKDRKSAVLLGFVLNAVPPMIVAGFFLWLFFGFKM
jgi:hypothetical protein